MNPKTRLKFDMLKKKVGAKTDNQLIYALVKLVYKFKFHEELKELIK